jgi:hypothetical protein
LAKVLGEGIWLLTGRRAVHTDAETSIDKDATVSANADT